MTRRRISTTAALLALALLASAACKRDRDSAAPEAEAEATPVAEIEELCEHSYELLIVAVGADSPGVRDDFMGACRDNSQARREELGEQAWAERSACLRAAEDRAALGRCDGHEPIEADRTPVDADGDLARRFCRHIVDVMSNDPDMAALLGPDQGAELFDDCLEAAQEQLGDDPERFEREARCILGVSSIEEFDRCDEPRS